MKNHPIIKEAAVKMDKSVKKIEEELRHLRTGRPSPAVLEEVKVDYYGVSTPINQLASISVLDERTLVIKPWDRSILGDVEKAILSSNLGLTPMNDGNAIKLVFPRPTTEQRKNWVKHAKEIVEQGKVAVRNVRRDGMKKIKEAQKSGEIPEDDAKRLEEEMQKTTDEHIKKLEELFEKKEKEIMEF